ncbi:hypothetical protein FBZ84_12370 [Azospirillum baldaniorum]|nr:hypothetical protein FBZ84_12370 [Azospirillum baldaniorum]
MLDRARGHRTHLDRRGRMGSGEAGGQGRHRRHAGGNDAELQGSSQSLVPPRPIGAQGFVVGQDLPAPGQHRLALPQGAPPAVQPGPVARHPDRQAAAQLPASVRTAVPARQWPPAPRMPRPSPGPQAGRRRSVPASQSGSARRCPAAPPPAPSAGSHGPAGPQRPERAMGGGSAAVRQVPMIEQCRLGLMSQMRLRRVPAGSASAGWGGTGTFGGKGAIPWPGRGRSGSVTMVPGSFYIWLYTVQQPLFRDAIVREGRPRSYGSAQNHDLSYVSVQSHGAGTPQRWSRRQASFRAAQSSGQWHVPC